VKPRHRLHPALFVGPTLFVLGLFVLWRKVPDIR
jgi:hypothetical protein